MSIDMALKNSESSKVICGKRKLAESVKDKAQSKKNTSSYQSKDKRHHVKNAKNHQVKKGKFTAEKNKTNEIERNDPVPIPPSIQDPNNEIQENAHMLTPSQQIFPYPILHTNAVMIPMPTYSMLYVIYPPIMLRPIPVNPPIIEEEDEEIINMHYDIDTDSCN